MTYHYTHTLAKEHTAQALGEGMGLSFKQCIMIGNQIRGKSLARAKTILRETMALKVPIKFTRFTNALGHRKGHFGPGRFPQKAATQLLALLESAEANAQFKGLNTGNLVVLHIAAQDGGNSWRYGRRRRIKAKRCHVEVVLAEGKSDDKGKAKKNDKKEKAATGKDEQKETKEHKMDTPKTEKKEKTASGKKGAP
ncbi:MAG: 50S ribosomal protein L22 [Nanoarchaeota archaeon]|nr:50S ribosomal protein L22 [Nanoarchaeota archaeon]